MSDVGGVGGTGGVDGGASPTDQTWSVDSESNTITLDNGYTVTFENDDQAWHIRDADGNDVRIWGDPHVHEGDGGKWDFKAQMTFELEDGTKITVKTKPIGDGSVTVSDELIITKGDQAIHVTGIADNNVQIGDVTMDGAALDAATADGYVATETGGVDDWSFRGTEITRNLPFVDYETYVAAMGLFENPPPLHLLDLTALHTAALAAGQTDDEYIREQLDQLEADMQAQLDDARQKMNQADNFYERKYYEDLVNALSTDISELQAGEGTGSVEDKINLYNRLAYEFHLEVEYNINITGVGTTWTQAELQELEDQLEMLPEDFTVFNHNLREIRREAMQPGVGGYNTGSGLIALGGGQITHAIIHEIGHDFDNENPRWDDFQAASGWVNHTSEFSDISDDFVGGVYTPLGGSARFSDGQVYHDGDPIDLDGDGVDDGIVQVHYGKVYVCDPDADFITGYASTNPKDDFAECFKYFFQDPQQLKNDCPDKYQFMVEYMGYDPLAAP